MVVVMDILIIALLIFCLFGVIDNNRKLTKITKKLEIFDIEDRKVPNDEIESELEDLNARK
ncbi:hypothetical protein [Radiobacillus sp. PE A8.2]|uniref:hypothetical protein n=1 Tax=Radiobacillus sp. PE A8.2 TaxID=3380349 RepID=UPI0038902909